MTQQDIQALQLLAAIEEEKRRERDNATFLDFLGRVIGAAGRGALGAGRFIEEGFQPVTQAFSSPVTDNPEATQRILNEPRVNQALSGAQAIGDTGAGALAESIAPAVSGETLGVGPNAFDAFILNLERQRQSQTLLDALTLQASRDQYRQTQFNPAQRFALEAVGDPTNLIPEAAALRALRLTGHVAPRVAGEGIESLVQAGAREIPNALERGTLQAERSAARQAITAPRTGGFRGALAEQARVIEQAGARESQTARALFRSPATERSIFEQDLPLFDKPIQELSDTELEELSTWADSFFASQSPGIQRDGTILRNVVDREIDRRGLEQTLEGGRLRIVQREQPARAAGPEDVQPSSGPETGLRHGRAVPEEAEPLVIKKIRALTPGQDGAVLSEAEQVELRDWLRANGTDFPNDPDIGGTIRGSINREYGGAAQIFVGTFESTRPGFPRQYVVWNPSRDTFRIHSTPPDLREMRVLSAQLQRFGPERILGRPGPNAQRTLDIFRDDIPQAEQGLRALSPPRQQIAAGPEDVGPSRFQLEMAQTGRLPKRPRVADLPPDDVAAIRQDTQFRAEVGPSDNARATINQALTDPASVPTEKLRVATVEVASPDGGAPPRRPGSRHPAKPSDFLSRAIESRRKGTGWKWNSLERKDQALLRLHDAAINVETRRARDVVTQGNKLLESFNWGKSIRGTRAPLTADDIADADDMYRALHGETEPPPSLKHIYDDLRKQMDFESAQRIDFDPEMATVDDYFYRGWKPPDGTRVSGRGQLVFTPAFKKPRTGATYSEMREAGFEPLFWNPYEQWFVARMQGVRYRQQMELVEALKASGDDVILPHTGGTAPEGWRVPKIGPAFEGKPMMIKDELTGEVTPGAVRQWIVPDRIANALENAYGKKPELGTVSVGSRDVKIQKVIDWLTFTPKRAKLLGTIFQQIDFAQRLGWGSAASAVDHILRGRPDLAIRDGLKYPPAVFDMLRANFSPSRRAALRRELDSTAPIIEGRPGVTMRSLMEQGLSVRDSSLIPQDVDNIVREAASNAGVLGSRNVLEGIRTLEKAMRDGLFEGAYPAAILHDARNITGPMMERLYGKKLTDAQLSARIAAVLNQKYSTIPETMSVVQNRFLRETMRRFFFSVNEQEAMLRQAVAPFRGADKGYWTRHWIGGFLFLMVVANAIHYASTGEPLPKERYIPVSKRGYNTRFASPDLPFNAGRSGLPATLDLVGQMDTSFRVLDPKGYIESRFSVPVSAAAAQWSGENYYGDRIDEYGPGGVVSRTAALANDLFAPIGAGPLAGSALREAVPQAAQVVPAGESRLGIGGMAVQGLGVNLRAYNFNELEDLRESRPEMVAQIDRELIRRKIDDAVRHANDPLHILGTTNNLKARLREARALGYESAVVILERALKSREERAAADSAESRPPGWTPYPVPQRR